LACSSVQALSEQGLHPLHFSLPAMGNVCCSRRALRADGQCSAELTGTPAPRAPRVDSKGNRLAVSPTSGRLVVIPRTDPDELPKLG
jgi:hypothetical protein